MRSAQHALNDHRRDAGDVLSELAGDDPCGDDAAAARGADHDRDCLAFIERRLRLRGREKKRYDRQSDENAKIRLRCIVASFQRTGLISPGPSP